jgi:hypothetical protein
VIEILEFSIFIFIFTKIENIFYCIVNNKFKIILVNMNTKNLENIISNINNKGDIQILYMFGVITRRDYKNILNSFEEKNRAHSFELSSPEIKKWAEMTLLPSIINSIREFQEPLYTDYLKRMHEPDIDPELIGKPQTGSYLDNITNQYSCSCVYSPVEHCVVSISQNHYIRLYQRLIQKRPYWYIFTIDCVDSCEDPNIRVPLFEMKCSCEEVSSNDNVQRVLTEKFKYIAFLFFKNLNKNAIEKDYETFGKSIKIPKLGII